MVLDSWLPTAAIQGRWRPPGAPRAKEAWRAVGLPDANPWALGGLASLAEVGWSTGAAQQRASSMAIVQDDSHPRLGFLAAVHPFR